MTALRENSNPQLQLQEICKNVHEFVKLQDGGTAY